MACIDDIVIATETVEDHLDRIREVFDCLREAGFEMRAKKCDFMRTETKYLGRVVSAGGIRPDPQAVEKVREWMPPRNKEELQSFLGFANYYRDFIPFMLKKLNRCRTCFGNCLLYTSPSPRDLSTSRMPSSA